MGKRSIHKFTAILLMLSVVFSLASCKKTEPDYVFLIESEGKRNYYSISNDTFERMSLFQFNISVEFTNKYTSPKVETDIVCISAEGDDPAEWEYSDKEYVPLDDEQKQIWIERMKAMNLPYTGSFSIMTDTFDDYMIACALKIDSRTLQYIGTKFVFHNEKIIGKVTETGMINRFYKRDQ